MSVFIPIPITQIEREHEQTSRTYRLDLQRGRIFAAGSVDELDAVNQFIRKTLVTPRFRCMIYDNQYGSELKQTVIASDVTAEFIETEVPRIVRDALSVDNRILDVYGFSFAFNDDEARIKFSANTVFGETTVDEVM